MAKHRWLTKDEKRLLAPHAERYSGMFEHIQKASTPELEKLLSASLACTTTNCWWAEYRAAEYLIEEIQAEIRWRNRLDADAAELADPIAHREMRWADDGGLVPAM